MEYQVITSTMPEFESMVEQAIERGWKPCGGVAVTVFPGGIVPFYAQALTREPQEKSDAN